MHHPPRPQTPHIFGILARNAPIAVLLRRGPSRWFHMTLWRTDTDKLTPGQWVHHRVYEHASALSPDGALFVYLAVGHNGRTFTGISRPPFFSCLARWGMGLPGGGGAFLDNRTLAAFSLDRDPLAKRENHLHVIPILTRDQFNQLPADITHHGWRQLDDLTWEKPTRLWSLRRHHKRRLSYQEAYLAKDRRPSDPKTYYGYHYTLHQRNTDRPLTADWADIDHAGRLVLTRDGQLFTLHITPTLLDHHQLADFRPDTPNPLPPPATALRWPRPPK